MRKYQKFSKILTLSLFCLSQIPLNTNVLGESTVPENGAKGKLVVKKTDDQNKPLSKAIFHFNRWSYDVYCRWNLYLEKV